MPAPAEIQQDSDAAWAIRFRERGTNAASRARRDRQDEQIGAADYNLRQRQAQDNEAFLQSKAGAGARDLMQQRNVAENQRRTRDLAEQRFQFDQEKRQFDDEFKIRTQQLQMNAERRRMNEELRKAERESLVISHTDKAEQEMDEVLKSGLVPGSPGFAAATMQVLLNSPHLEKSVRDTFLQTARIEGDPDLIVGQAKELGLEPSGARVVNGKLVPTFKQPVENDKIGRIGTANNPKPRDFDKEISTARREWSQLVELEHKLKEGDERLPVIQQERKLAEERLTGLRNEKPTRANEKGSGMGDVRTQEPVVKGEARANEKRVGMGDIRAQEPAVEAPAAPPTITTQEQFNALPSKAVYIGKDGVTRYKP